MKTKHWPIYTGTIQIGQFQRLNGSIQLKIPGHLFKPCDLELKERWLKKNIPEETLKVVEEPENLRENLRKTSGIPHRENQEF